MLNKIKNLFSRKKKEDSVLERIDTSESDITLGDENQDISMRVFSDDFLNQSQANYQPIRAGKVFTMDEDNSNLLDLEPTTWKANTSLPQQPNYKITSGTITASNLNVKNTREKQFTSNMQQMVADFHTAFNHPVSDKPVLIELNRLVDRKGWGTLEEMVEQIHSVANNEDEFLSSIERIKQYLDKAVDKQLSREFIQGKEDKIVALADGLADELYFLLGDAVEAGIDIEKILTIVQDSNMSKLYTDEKTGEKYAKYDENDKIMKSPEFVPPEPRIEAEIKNQIRVAESSEAIKHSLEFGETKE